MILDDDMLILEDGHGRRLFGNRPVPFKSMPGITEWPPPERLIIQVHEDALAVALVPEGYDGEHVWRRQQASALTDEMSLASDHIFRGAVYVPEGEPA